MLQAHEMQPYIDISFLTLYIADNEKLLGYDSEFLFASPVKINFDCTSSTAQGGGGSFKHGKPIVELGCCESRMAERSHC